MRESFSTIICLRRTNHGMSSLSLDKICIGDCLRRKRLSEYDGGGSRGYFYIKYKRPPPSLQATVHLYLRKNLPIDGNGRDAPHSCSFSPETLSRARSHRREPPDELYPALTMNGPSLPRHTGKPT
jgi:hypothetical protein